MREKYEYDYVFDWTLQNYSPNRRSQTAIERGQKERQERPARQTAAEKPSSPNKPKNNESKKGGSKCIIF